MPNPTVAALQGLLLETADILSHRSLDMWRPTFGNCKARIEGTESAAYAGINQSVWGDGPLQIVWKGSNLLYIAVLEHVRAAAALMRPPHRFWSAAAQARVAVEAAAQVRWLLDPSVPDGRTRVGRYYTLYHHFSGQLEYTHSKALPGTSVEPYGRSRAHMETEAAALNLAPVTNKKNEIIGYEGQQWPKTDELVSKIVGSTGGYNVLSGASHAEFWSLLGAYREGEPSPFGVTRDANEQSFESFKLVTRACMNAMTTPAFAAWQLFRRELLANDLIRINRLAMPLVGDL